MKKIILPILLFVSTLSFAQVCVPGTLTAPKNAYIIPDSATNFVNACAGTYYEQILYIKAAKDTVISITTPITATLTADIDSFVIDANITGLPSYLTAVSVPGLLPAAGSSLPKSNFSRLLIKGDSLACVKISGTIPAGTATSTLNLGINLRVYTSNIHSADLVVDALVPSFYPGRKTDTNTTITDYRINVFATPCFPNAVNNLAKYNFDLVASVPNPANATAQIVFESAKQDSYSFKLTNVMGETVLTKSVKASIGANYLSIDVSSMPNGMYLYSLSDGKNILCKKMEISK